MLETLLRQDRLIVSASLLLVSAACWIYLLTGAGMGMTGIEMTRHSMMGMDMMPSPAWSVSHVLVMFFMWWLMMIAMMLPSATPVVLLSAALNRMSQPGRRPFGSATAFTSGYLLAWAAFSAIAVAAQYVLQTSGMINGMLASRQHGFSAALLFVAGAWQFAPWKQACLSHCRSPVEYLTLHRRPGKLGALLMGARHGLYCLGCCWFLMVLLFVGGVMNLLWIAGLAVYVWVEKILPGGETVSRIMGGLLIAWSALIMLGN